MKYEKTLSHRITIIKQFLSYITAQNKQLHDYTRHFKSVFNITVQKRNTDFLTPEETTKLLAYLKKKCSKSVDEKANKFINYRDALIVVIAAVTGARISEVLSLKFKDIKIDSHSDNGSKKSYYVFSAIGKGNSLRTIIIPDHYIKNYMKYLGKILESNDYIASGTVKGDYPLTNKPISYNHALVFFHKTIQELNIDKRGFHILRRGYVTQRLFEGATIEVVAQEVGHKSYNTTLDNYFKNNPKLLAKSRLKQDP